MDENKKPSQQSTIVDFINSLTTENNNKKTSNIIRLHSTKRITRHLPTNSDSIQSALNYAKSLDW